MAMPNPYIENKTIAMLDKAYLTKKRGSTYTACEEINFQWSISEVNEFIGLWNSGTSIVGLSQRFSRTQNDVAILILDLRLNGRIEVRERGLWG